MLSARQYIHRKAAEKDLFTVGCKFLSMEFFHGLNHQVYQRPERLDQVIGKIKMIQFTPVVQAERRLETIWFFSTASSRLCLAKGSVTAQGMCFRSQKKTALPLSPSADRAAVVIDERGLSTSKAEISSMGMLCILSVSISSCPFRIEIRAGFSMNMFRYATYPHLF